MIKMAVEAVNLGHIDEVWIVPCGSREDIKMEVTNQQRLDMVNLIVADYFKNEFPIKVFNIF